MTVYHLILALVLFVVCFPAVSPDDQLKVERHDDKVVYEIKSSLKDPQRNKYKVEWKHGDIVIVIGNWRKGHGRGEAPHRR
ncbi:MAG: hypothetical protein RMJ39_10105 [Deltaproteobacteria bacterium]|nr:hypothetical protein [Deltaproteobacteria bacterium]